MNFMIKLISNRIRLVLLTIGISVLAIFISFVWNYQLSSIINAVNDKNLISPYLILTAAITILISSAIAYALSLLSGWTCETLTHDLRMGFARKLNSISIIEIENMNAGEQLSKLQNEVSDVSGYLRSNLFPIVDDGIRFLATFVWMLILNPKLTILAHLPALLILLYIVFSSKIIETAAKKSQEANAQMCGYIDTLTSVFPIIKIFDGAKLICIKYKDALSHWENLSYKEERTRARLMSLSGILSCIPLLLLFLMGGTQVIQGQLSIGILYIFINLSGNVSGILMNLPGRISGFRRFMANMKRLQTSVQIK